MLRLEPGEALQFSALLIFNLSSFVVAELTNYYNWPATDPPITRTETHEAGRETRIRCQINERFRRVQGLKLTWEYKPCQTGSFAVCMEAGGWSRLCGGEGPRCPPIYTLLDPRAQDSGLYRCHITLWGPVTTVNVYMLHFNDNRREPPAVVGGMDANVTVVAPQLASLHCKVRSPVPPIIRWFRRLDSTSSQVLTQPRHNFIQYLNNSYQLLNCCPIAALSQKDLYLSKLVISSSSVYDSGFYICLAINNANYTLREAYINVLPLLRATGERPQTGSFLVLFLIPALFALIPTLVWMMCLRSRKSAALEPTVPLGIDKPLVVQTHVLSDQPVISATK